MDDSAPLLVYIASASQDEDLRKALEKHLAVLVRQNRISIWHRQLIPLGTNAQQMQQEQIANAAIILLLMSANFLDECYAEIDLAASRISSTIVIPILLRAVDLQDTPFEQLQCLPRNGSPIEECRNRNKAFQEIVHEIRAATLSQSLPQKKHIGEKERKLKAMLADHRGFIQDRLGSFVGRHNEQVEILQRIEEKMKTGGYVTITGQAGQGKSSIIAKLVEHYGTDMVAFHFIPLNPGPDHQVGLLRNLMARLIIKYDLSDLYVASESRAALREYFPKALTEIAEKGGQEVIFVDGLDQLKEDDNGERDLSFLPDSPPTGFVFVIGTRPNDTLRPLKLLKPHNEYQLPNLSRQDFALILKRHKVYLVQTHATFSGMIR
jgi:TIR domain